MSETREWTVEEPREHDVYAAELESGKIYPIIASPDAGHLYVRTIMGGEIHEKIVRYYGPLTSDELLAGIPKPPPRLPKAHPDRYLAPIAKAKYEDIDGLVLVSSIDRDGDVPIATLDGGPNDFWTASYLSVYPNRYAQQGTDGVWREVEL
jgi:hypothetical protein